MQLVLLTAIGVGGATVLGALLGLFFKRVPHQYNDTIMGFSAGVMVAAALLGLTLPAMELGGVWVVVLGVVAGTLALNGVDRFIPHLHHLTGMKADVPAEHKAEHHRIFLFILAIAIHNFPEGLAAGVGFGGENIGNAISVAAGIALQNVPEGLIVITPLLRIGIPRGRAFLLAAGTGVIEVVGTLLGYWAVHFSLAILPFALSFAAGMMLYVVFDEMIPETHSHGFERQATYALLGGILLMLVMSYYIG